MSLALSDEMLEANRPAWEAMQNHRFVRDVESDRLPDDVFKSYLIHECDFVETAMLIFGHMLVKAPGLAERRWLAGVLQALAADQIGYFERAFAALGIAAEDRARPPPAAVPAFRDGMLAVARDGSYLDGVVVMLAAEWMYATWCERAARSPITNRELKRWVDLHAEAGFEAQAAWLRRQADQASPMEAGDRRRLAALFGRALLLEIDFHDAPYGDAGARAPGLP